MRRDRLVFDASALLNIIRDSDDPLAVLEGGYLLDLACLLVAWCWGVLSGDRFVVIRVPREVVEGAKVPEGEFERVARVELAVALYARGVLSLGQARRLAGLSKWGLLGELARRGVVRHYAREELEDDARFSGE